MRASSTTVEQSGESEELNDVRRWLRTMPVLGWSGSCTYSGVSTIECMFQVQFVSDGSAVTSMIARQGKLSEHATRCAAADPKIIKVVNENHLSFHGAAKCIAENYGDEAAIELRSYTDSYLAEDSASKLSGENQAAMSEPCVVEWLSCKMHEAVKARHGTAANMSAVTIGKIADETIEDILRNSINKELKRRFLSCAEHAIENEVWPGCNSPYYRDYYSRKTGLMSHIIDVFLYVADGGSNNDKATNRGRFLDVSRATEYVMRRLHSAKHTTKHTRSDSIENWKAFCYALAVRGGVDLNERNLVQVLAKEMSKVGCDVTDECVRRRMSEVRKISQLSCK